MERALKKKDSSEVIIRVVMRLYDRAKTRVRVGSVNSEEYEVKVDVHLGSML